MTKRRTSKIPRNQKSGFDYYYVDYKINEAKTEVMEMISHLPTKDEFYDKMDEIMVELKTIRETQEILTPKTYDLEERLEKIEKIHPRGKHPVQT